MFGKREEGEGGERNKIDKNLVLFRVCLEKGRREEILTGKEMAIMIGVRGCGLLN